MIQLLETLSTLLNRIFWRFAKKTETKKSEKKLRRDTVIYFSFYNMRNIYHSEQRFSVD